MDDPNGWYDLFEKISKVLKLPITGWTVAAILVILLLWDKISKAVNVGLDHLGRSFGGAWSYRRYLDTYKGLLLEYHTHLKLVGVRVEEERQPKVAESYVPIKLEPHGAGLETALSVEAILAKCPTYATGLQFFDQV
jgi:hypothetical protein